MVGYPVYVNPTGADRLPNSVSHGHNNVVIVSEQDPGPTSAVGVGVGPKATGFMTKTKGGRDGGIMYT